MTTSKSSFDFTIAKKGSFDITSLHGVTLMKKGSFDITGLSGISVLKKGSFDLTSYSSSDQADGTLSHNHGDSFSIFKAAGHFNPDGVILI